MKKTNNNNNTLEKAEAKILSLENEILELKKENKILQKKVNDKYILSIKYAFFVAIIGSVYMLSKISYKFFNSKNKQHNIIKRSPLYENSENLWGVGDKTDITKHNTADFIIRENEKSNHTI